MSAPVPLRADSGSVMDSAFTAKERGGRGGEKAAGNNTVDGVDGRVGTDVANGLRIGSRYLKYYNFILFCGRVMNSLTVATLLIREMVRRVRVLS